MNVVAEAAAVVVSVAVAVAVAVVMVVLVVAEAVVVVAVGSVAFVSWLRLWFKPGVPAATHLQLIPCPQRNVVGRRNDPCTVPQTVAVGC